MSDALYLPIVSALLGGAVTQGYAVTADAAGTTAVVATTAAIAASKTGTYDGIAIQTNVAGKVIEVQREGRVDATYVPWLGTGAVEVAVIDGNGKPQRASASAGSAVGFVDKQGNLWISFPLGSLAYTTVYYQTVQANGADQTQRGKLNFGNDFAVTDDAGNNRSTVALVTFWARPFMMRGA